MCRHFQAKAQGILHAKNIVKLKPTIYQLFYLEYMGYLGMDWIYLHLNEIKIQHSYVAPKLRFEIMRTSNSEGQLWGSDSSESVSKYQVSMTEDGEISLVRTHISMNSKNVSMKGSKQTSCKTLQSNLSFLNDL